MHAKAPPPETFYNKSIRLAHNGIETIGTLKGLYEAGRALYGGMQTVGTYARPLMALM